MAETLTHHDHQTDDEHELDDEEARVAENVQRVGEGVRVIKKLTHHGKGDDGHHERPHLGVGSNGDCGDDERDPECHGRSEVKGVCE